MWSFTILSSLILASSSVNISVIKRSDEQSSQPVAKQKVEIFSFRQGQMGSAPLEAITNQNGRTTVRLDRIEETTFIARTLFEGVPYVSEPFPGTQKQVAIEVYSAQAEVPEVRVADLRMSISHANSSLVVEQEILIENPTFKTYVGKPNKNRQVETFRFTLPSKAFNLRLQQGFDEANTHFEGNEIVIGTAINPGLSRFLLEFQIDRPFLRHELNQTFSLPVALVSVGSPLSISSGTNPLQSLGNKFVGDSLWKLWESSSVGRNPVDILVSGIPLRFRITHALPLILFLILIGFMILTPRQANSLSASDEEALIREFGQLKTLRGKNLIPETEFERERLRILTELEASYLSKRT